MPSRRSLLVVLAVTQSLGRARAAHAEAFAGVAYGIDTFELGTATTLALEFAGHSSDRTAYVAPGVLVAGSVGVGLLTAKLDAPLAGAYGVHGALMGGLELYAIGGLLDRDQLGRPRFRRLALGLGVLGAAGGAWLGGVRIPTDSFAMPWQTAPVVGGVGATIVMGVKEMAFPSAHAARNLVLAAAVGGGAGLVLGWWLGERHQGDIEPYQPGVAASAGQRLLTISGSW